MTVSSTSSRIVYVGDGSATDFPFAFKVNQPADLVVVYTDAGGTDIVLSPSQYAATGFGLDAGGSVTYPLSGGAIAAPARLTIYRDVAVTQPTSLSNQGAMWPQVIEAALDRLTYVAQKVTDAVSRAVVISPTDSSQLTVLPNAATRANSVLAFDGAGQPYAATLTGSLVDVATWLVNNFLAAATSAASARAALGAAGLVETGTIDVSGGRLKAPTRASGDSGSDVATTAFVTRAALRSYLAGLGLSNNVGAPNARIDVATGICADDTNTQMLSLASGTLDCTTTGANGLDTGSLANNTWYHAFAIGKPDGTTARLASTSPTSPALPAGYTLKRRIGSFKTDVAAHILLFVQDGDSFMWKTPVMDLGGVSGTNPGTSAVNRTLVSVPTGVRMQAVLNIVVNNSGSDFAYCLITDRSLTDMAPSVGNSDTPKASIGTALKAVWTDTSAQVRSRISYSDALTGLILNTLGWIDHRGRNA
ncbi:MAG: hypothetical protein J0J01_05065 [Reyranella sp.]|uniref:hypothetical protein n=1 Tax=Reyranella sp. TaxID=1929291 RepID=UPI001AC819FA|nr:hypothetical protein [Reyranella sp.]MBN9086255.1 hypothetical protein [Reyranella sp.]